ncbi:MAG: hypothetical protein ACI86H_002990 [bacterium]|jgi:hypothetical protein
MKKLLTFLIVTSFLTFGVVDSVVAKTPVAFLFNVKGKVEYQKKNKRWKKVRRNKFLFANYKVRTTSGASVHVMNKKTNTTQILGSNSVIQINTTEIVALKGSLQSSSGNTLMAGLDRRFSQSQKYTTVRRSHKKSKKIKVILASNISISKAYPELVWQSVGAGYTYKLTVGSNEYSIPAVSKGLVRAKVNLSSGVFKYSVKVIESGSVVYKSKAKKVKWISNSLNQKMVTKIKQIKKIDSEGFLLGNYFKDQNFLIPAMIQYQSFFKSYPKDTDINEMRPVLIEVYTRLKLKKLKKNEYDLYNELRFED